jgi:TRAP-type C4-dicarboxylate transport system substrate-binding protein
MAAAPAVDPPVLYVGHSFNEGTFQQQLVDAFARKVSESGTAQLRPVPVKKLGNSVKALLESVRAGHADMAIVPFEVAAEAVEGFGIFTTPFLFEGYQRLKAVQKGEIGRDLLRQLSRAELVGVGWWAGEFKAIAGDKPLLQPLDLIDRRIGFVDRTPDGLQKSDFGPSWSYQANARPFLLPPTLPNSPISFEGTEFIEATPLELRRAAGGPKFISLTNHLNDGHVVVANRASWGKLSQASRTALIAAFDEAYDIATDGLDRGEQSLRQLAPGNAAVLALTSADRRLWLERTRVPMRDSRIGGLIAHVADYPLAVFVSTPAPPARISWNTWLEDGQGRDVPSLVAGRVATLNLDLARLPYARLMRASADARIKEGLASGAPLQLLIQPLLLGPQIEAVPGQSFGMSPMTASLKNVATLASDEVQRQAHWEGKLSTRQLAASLGMSDILQWKIRGNDEGCADVAFAVWDEARNEPLDHVVVTLPVRREDGPAITCYGKPDSMETAAGLETLLQGTRAVRTAADAALHVFEYNDSGSTRSIAVLVHARRLAAARGSAGVKDPGVYSWELVSPLSSYVSGAAQLPKLVGEAHQRVANGVPFPYEAVAGDLATVLFAGKTQRDREQGQLAAAALKDAIEKGSPGRVLTRLINESGRSMYLPLGLLAARASVPFASKRFSVIQSLAGGARGPQACIRSWHVARTSTLAGAGGVAKKLLEEAPAQLPAPAALMTTHEAMAFYLGSQPTLAQGEGFIVLAHHDAGSLRFSPAHSPPPWIRSENINRRFPAGSMAVLAACSTTGVGQQTSMIVNRLASQGMASIVLSPFAVDIEFGVRMALAFEGQILKEMGKPTGATAAILFERSAEAAAASLPAAAAALYDMSLEFQLVGDPDITICDSQGG